MALLLAGTVLSACGSDSADGGDNPDDGGSTETLIVNTSFVVKTLDPNLVYEPTGNIVVHALYDSLVTFEGADISKPVGDLAESYHRLGGCQDLHLQTAP